MKMKMKRNRMKATDTPMRAFRYICSPPSGMDIVGGGVEVSMGPETVSSTGALADDKR